MKIHSLIINRGKIDAANYALLKNVHEFVSLIYTPLL